MGKTLTETLTKKVYLETLGCQSNVVESDHVAGLLLKEGFSLTPNTSEADVILFNTCSVRQHAEDKIFSRLGELTDWKNDKPGRVLGVLGCMATSHKQNIIDRAPQVDLVLGPDQYPKAAGAIAQASRGSGPQVLADFDPSYFPQNDPARLSAPHRAFVEIMKGCDKFCTFCVVPFTRGREVSRDPGDILDEITRIAQAGVKEVMLLGQNVNSYGLSSSYKKNDMETGMAMHNQGPVTFPELLRQVGAVPGIERVRFMTSHPLDLSDDLVSAMAETPAVCEMIHLPVQCGSDTVLKRMNRKYTVSHYLGRVTALRKVMPELAITTDLIVGFPGETDEDFEGTLRLLDEVRYDLVYSFKYSPRIGTPAARMLHQVPENLKDERLARLNEKAWKHAADRHLSRIGEVEVVLVEGEADKTPGAYFGKTRQNRTVVFPAVGLKAGDRVKVKIEKSKIASLYGRIITEKTL
jgi:tRNA-2-methylthio-N6-dimethylallyladenosine synthase